MALQPNFPTSPCEVLPPYLRWFPAAEELRITAYEKLLPPLVAKVREEVAASNSASVNDGGTNHSAGRLSVASRP